MTDSNRRRSNSYFKGHGLGNEYIVLDPDELTFALTPGRIAGICDRRNGIGSDGVLTMDESDTADFGLRIWNPDGSEAETSGNGLRIFACFLHATGRTRKKSFTVETLGGTVRVETWHERQCAEDEDGAVIAKGETGPVSCATVHMGKATFRPEALPCTLEVDELIEQPINVAGASLTFTGVSVGNPHCVVFHPRGQRWTGTGRWAKADPRRPVDQLWRHVDLLRLGPTLETHPIFPQRTNVQLAACTGPDSIRILIWERGAGETPSSGSSACAAASAAVRLGLAMYPVTVESPGGALVVAVNEEFELTLTGPVAEVARGTFNQGMLYEIMDADN